MTNPFDDASVRSAFGAAGITHRPGLAQNLLQEMAPLLAEEGIDVNDPSTFDIDSLNAALGRAVERSNLERFTPVGGTRKAGLSILRLIVVGIDDGMDSHMQAIVGAISPEPPGVKEPSVAHMIGLSLSLLDTWFGDAASATSLSKVSIPKWSSRSRAAATDILALARQRRAFDSIGTLHRKHSGEMILHGSILAVAGTVQAWAASDGMDVSEISARALM
jgi:hypothetical protein